MSTFVGQLMSSPVITVERTACVAEAAQKCLDRNVNALIVVTEEGHFHGIVTTSDLLQLLSDDRAPAEASLDEYVTTDVVTVMSDTQLREAADLLLENDIHHLPVIGSDQTVRGVLSTQDVAEFLSNTR